MAVKKTEKTTNEVEIKSPKKNKKIIFLEKQHGKYAEKELFVGVNGKNYLIKRGEYVEVPDAVYEVVMNSKAAQEAAYDEIEKLSDNFANGKNQL